MICAQISLIKWYSFCLCRRFTRWFFCGCVSMKSHTSNFSQVIHSLSRKKAETRQKIEPKQKKKRAETNKKNINRVPIMSASICCSAHLRYVYWAASSPRSWFDIKIKSQAANKKVRSPSYIHNLSIYHILLLDSLIIKIFVLDY